MDPHEGIDLHEGGPLSIGWRFRVETDVEPTATAEKEAVYVQWPGPVAFSELWRRDIFATGRMKPVRAKVSFAGIGKNRQ